MPQTKKRLDELLNKANSLPLLPGVYIMKDQNGKIIYVGKSRKLKNRVSQYFQNSYKNIKTNRMVSSTEDFDYILCKTEIEALSLENSLIKQYTPKYNIKLKDAKSYPYIKITAEKYPRILFTRSRLSDKAKYFGPFSGTATVYSILDILHKSLGIPNCKRSFPKDIGKERPCIYYQMKKCCGLCTGEVSCEEYASLIHCASEILKGNISVAKEKLEEQMFELAEAERFEAAARCRDTIRSLERLNQKQNVVASPDTNLDAFGLYTDDFSNSISVMYVRNGTVTDKNDWIFGKDVVSDSNSISAFLVEHYMLRHDIPKTIILSFELEEADNLDLETFLSERAGYKVTVKKAERGVLRGLCDVVYGNAQEKARQSKLEAQKDESTLFTLADMLRLESLPMRIEAYDISNIGAENITAGMVVFNNGKACKSDYRAFNIKTVKGDPNDYASMREALHRRIKHLKEDNSGSFSQYPDLLLIDGGKGHVAVVKEVLREENIELPVFGMVKDDFHKTRALCTENEEINIAREKSVFMLIYRIQEEVHRFTVNRTTSAKRATIKRSSLENINGIGPTKAKKLLLAFGTLAAIKNASEEEIATVKGISASDAHNVFLHYNKKQ
jgi:excinuclease ABC subunit C